MTKGRLLQVTNESFTFSDLAGRNVSSAFPELLWKISRDMRPCLAAGAF